MADGFLSKQENLELELEPEGSKEVDSTGIWEDLGNQKRHLEEMSSHFEASGAGITGAAPSKDRSSPCSPPFPTPISRFQPKKIASMILEHEAPVISKRGRSSSR